MYCSNKTGAPVDEVDELCAHIDARADSLRDAGLGRQFELGGATFLLVSQKDNAIYRVRREGNRWFLKFPCGNRAERIQHEIAGAQAMEASLGSSHCYQHADVIRISDVGLYTLYSAVHGANPNPVLHRACLLAIAGLGSGAAQSFEHLGYVLGRMHNFSGGSDLWATADSLRLLRRDLESVSASHPIAERISAWIDCDPPSERSWIHGNIKSRDIFMSKQGVCIIDFESCGQGSPYEDLAGLFSHMILLRALPIFPWRRARQAMTAMLNGYRGERPVDRRSLCYYITLRVCRYYVTNAILRHPPSLVGVPIVGRKLTTMIECLLNEELEFALEGVELW